MPARIRPISLLVASILGTVASGIVLAQSVIVTNGPAINSTIPLAPNSTVEFDTAGNLRVSCALTAGVCTALAGTVAPVGAPTSSFTRADSNTDVKTNQSVSFSWTSSGAEACKASAVTPGGVATSWSGVRDTAGSENAVVSSVGTYAFSLQCFNAGGGSTKQTVSVPVTAPSGGGGPVTGCNLPPDPQLQPAGWTRTDKSWSAAWTAPAAGTAAVYPSNSGNVAVLGAEKGAYTTIPFIPNANEVIQVYWESVQSQGNYPRPRPADGMYFAISPCPGDLRKPDPDSSDLFLQAGCRRGAASTSMIFHTLSNPSDHQSCRLQAGQTYYMTVIAANPEDGLVLGEHSCGSAANSALGCDVQATHKPAQ